MKETLTCIEGILDHLFAYKTRYQQLNRVAIGARKTWISSQDVSREEWLLHSWRILKLHWNGESNFSEQAGMVAHLAELHHIIHERLVG